MSEDVTLLEDGLFELLNASDGPVQQDLRRRALAVEEAQKRLLSLPGTGRIYRRGAITHQASAPGAPPAVDRGLLRASVSTELGHDEQGAYADVGTTLDYGVWLELGHRVVVNGRTVGYAEPRPWVRPSQDAAKL